jgi:stalled ribosome alternative rescue factor ArfA
MTRHLTANEDKIMAKRRNPAAQAVRTPMYRPRVVAPKKGKGSYKRNKTTIKN